MALSLDSEAPGSDAFVHQLSSLVNKEDVREIVSTQKHMLNRFEKTNEMLSSFNKLSSNHYDEKVEQFKNHTRTLLDMKRELDTIFKRIKVLKTQVARQYPDAYEASQEMNQGDDLDDDDRELASKEETK
ncbi:kxDL motif-containing protein 1-like [Ptychodera flava]|uniref:kxDL motif-containing protein 1-like n=1 Tax=Ptychodera flava TaxID=63121 RepID=UPI00396A4980